MDGSLSNKPENFVEGYSKGKATRTVRLRYTNRKKKDVMALKYLTLQTQQNAVVSRETPLSRGLQPTPTQRN